MPLFRRDHHSDQTKYRMREKMFSIGDDFWIENEAGERAFKVDGKALRLRDTLILQDPSGSELFKVQEKALRVRDTMQIERDGDTVATVKKALVHMVRDRFSVEVEGGEDLEAKGNIVDHEYKVERDGDHVAEVSKRWFRVRDTYGIEIAPGEDDALILAVVVCIDQMSENSPAPTDDLGIPAHEVDRRPAVRRVSLFDNAKAAAAVDVNIARSACGQERADAIRPGLCQSGLDQRLSEAAALSRRFHGDRVQLPQRLRREARLDPGPERVIATTAVIRQGGDAGMSPGVRVPEIPSLRWHPDRRTAAAIDLPHHPEFDHLLKEVREAPAQTVLEITMHAQRPSHHRVINERAAKHRGKRLGPARCGWHDLNRGSPLGGQGSLPPGP
jgi:uncharacterized protein YxjI